MTYSFQDLREILADGSYSSYKSAQFSEGCHQRLIDALHGLGTLNSPGQGDIASLVRHVLRREDKLQKEGNSTLKVPRKDSWPSREIWQRSGINVLGENSDSYIICANAWQPDWLKFSDRNLPDVPVYQEEIRRNYQPEAGDPFLALLGRENYLSIGQQQAIRTVLTAPKGSTLVVNLPTGSGKSLVAQLPALLASQTAGVSVIVVPTTALALDQERALASNSGINHPTAYYGGESVGEQQKRQDIRSRIRDGSQRIVFTSPESLIDSLAPCLYEAAQSGILRYFVIDEAHIVEQWGDEFRPAFQEIPGLRRDLLRQSSFNTLLLTATLTESCLDTLEILFAEPGLFQVISAVQLRPEPAYWFSRCKDEEIRQQKLIEAVANLPRPLIIYATKVEDVQHWKTILFDAGFKRCGIMTGKSTSEERLRLIKDWREKRIDIVVATSAFGLGVDQADVRAVIHVCIPETIDRFYQEVGRGGRDGKASISLMLHTAQDLEIAKSLNEKSYITIERGLERWESMFTKKESVGGDKFRVPVNIPPSLRLGDIDMNSQQNTAWNIRTLTLMSRAGLLEIDAEQPPQRRDFQSEEDYNKAIQKHRNFRVVRILNEYHLERETWELEVEPVRLKSQDKSYHNLKLMREALTVKRCLSEIFAEAYTIPERDQPTPRNQVGISRACGGCPNCRKTETKRFSGIMPSALIPWKKPDFIVGDQLKHLLNEEQLLLIFYESVQERGWERHRNRVFKWFIEQGIRNIVALPEFKRVLIEQVKVNNISDAYLFFFEEYKPLKMPKIPTLIFHSGVDPVPEKYLSKNSSSQAPRIVMLPRDSPDPSREDRKLINIFSGRYFLFNQFRTEISL